MENRNGLARRKVLLRIVQGFTVTGFAFLTWPFVKAWLPSLKQDVSLEVPVDDLQPGKYKLIDWLGRRVLVQRRSDAMLRYLDQDRSAGDEALELKDPVSAHSRQPAAAENPYRSLMPEYFVAFNNCTHLGCEVATATAAAAGVGFECPCHQSLYDHAGRVVVGAAAPTNLEVPRYSFVARSIIRLESELA